MNAARAAVCWVVASLCVGCCLAQQEAELRSWQALDPEAKAAAAGAVSNTFLRLSPERQRHWRAVGAEASLLAGREQLARELTEPAGGDVTQLDDASLTVHLRALIRLEQLAPLVTLLRSQLASRRSAVEAALLAEEYRVQMLAVGALATDARDQALTVFRALGSIEPVQSYRLANLALSLRQLGHIEQARATYVQGLALAPDDLELWNDYGLMLRANGQLERALGAFRRSVAIDLARPEPDRATGPAITNLMHQEALYPGSVGDDPVPTAQVSLRKRDVAVMLRRLDIDVQLDRLCRTAAKVR